MNMAIDFLKKVPFRGIGHASFQAGAVAIDWAWLQRNVKNINDSQRGMHILAMMGSGAIQVVRPMIEKYVADGFGMLTNNKFNAYIENKTAAKMLFDSMPFVILIGSAYFAGLPMQTDTIASLCLRSLAQLGVQKGFYPDVKTVTNTVIQYQDREVVREHDVYRDRWSLSPQLVVSSKNIETLEGIDPTGKVVFSKVNRGPIDSPVEFWQGMERATNENAKQMIDRYSRLTATEQDGIWRAIELRNQDKDVNYLIYPDNAVKMVLDCSDKHTVNELSQWFVAWSQNDTTHLDVMEIKAADEERLRALLLNDNQHVIEKISTLRLSNCTLSAQFLFELKQKYPNICAFDVCDSNVITAVSTSGTVQVDEQNVGKALNNLLLARKKGTEAAPRCIVVENGSGQITSNLHEEVSRLDRELIEKLCSYLSKLGSNAPMREVKLIPDRMQFPAVVFMEEVAFLKHVSIKTFSTLEKKLGDSFPHMKILDLSGTSVRFTYVLKFLKHLPIRTMRLTSCGSLFTSKNGGLHGISVANAVLGFSQWMNQTSGKLYLDIEASPFYQGSYELSDEEGMTKALEYHGTLTVDGRLYHQFVSEMQTAMQERRDNTSHDMTLVATSHESMDKRLTLKTTAK